MKAFVIAGGLPQIELLNQLRARKIITVLADGNDNCVAKQFADIFYKIQIFDIEKVKDIAIKEKVDFLITVCADQVLLVAAQVSEILNLPFYIDYQTAQNVSDKIKMKKIFKANGIPTSNFIEMKHFDPKLINHLKYPLVVKPVDSYSSRGVRRVNNLEEFYTFYHEAEKISRTHCVIVEEYVIGEEISVDAFIINGKAHILCVSNSDKILDDNRFVIYRGKYPVELSKEVLHKIEDIAQKITEAFNLVNAPLLIQLLTDGEEISVLEFCARSGGNTKYLLIKYSCGVDIIKSTIDIILGKTPNIEKTDTGNAIVVNDFIYCKPGIFDTLVGFEDLKSKGILKEYHALRAKGQEIKGVTSSSDRISTYTIVANSKDEFNTKLDLIVQNVRINDPNGNDIMRHDLLLHW